jgi:uncharacterized beta-barrel protein YwiB (DUF1934 family)
MMKKAIFVNFTNYVYQNERIDEYKISNDGELELVDGENRVSFYDTNNQDLSKIELIYSPSRVILKKTEPNRVSKLTFIKNKDVINQYLTTYGNMELVSRIINYEYKEYQMMLEYYLLIQNEIQGKYKIVLEIEE